MITPQKGNSFRKSFLSRCFLNYFIARRSKKTKKCNFIIKKKKKMALTTTMWPLVIHKKKKMTNCFNNLITCNMLNFPLHPNVLYRCLIVQGKSVYCCCSTYSIYSRKKYFYYSIYAMINRLRLGQKVCVQKCPQN